MIGRVKAYAAIVVAGREASDRVECSINLRMHKGDVYCEILENVSLGPSRLTGEVKVRFFKSNTGPEWIFDWREFNTPNIQYGGTIQLTPGANRD